MGKKIGILAVVVFFALGVAYADQVVCKAPEQILSEARDAIK